MPMLSSVLYRLLSNLSFSLLVPGLRCLPKYQVFRVPGNLVISDSSVGSET